MRAHDGSLDLVCTQQRILKILTITGLTEVFGSYETVDQAITATMGRRKERGSRPSSALRHRRTRSTPGGSLSGSARGGPARVEDIRLS